MTRISANSYHFARKPTQTEISPNEATTEDANKDEGDSEFQPTRSDENPSAATQSDNEAQGASTTERTHTEFSKGKKLKKT